jgi:hypothetical protein
LKLGGGVTSGLSSLEKASDGSRSVVVVIDIAERKGNTMPLESGGGGPSAVRWRR